MTEPRPLAARLLREPTLHFLLLAGVLFAVGALFGDADERVVELDPVELEARVRELGAQRGAPLDDAERRLVEQAYVDELILVREALLLGLEDDPRIRDVLVQKMLHVLSADVIQPTTEELTAFHRDRAARYTRPGRATVDELVVPTDGALPGPLAAGLAGGADARALSSAHGLRHNVLPDVSTADLSRLFGDETASRIEAAAEGTWVGPHATVRGQHWFRVVERTAPELVDLERVRDQVRLDWIAEQEAERLERRVAELRARYRVVVAGEGGG